MKRQVSTCLFICQVSRLLLKKYTLSCELIKVHARKRFDVNLDLTESGAGD